ALYQQTAVLRQRTGDRRGALGGQAGAVRQRARAGPGGAAPQHRAGGERVRPVHREGPAGGEQGRVGRVQRQAGNGRTDVQRDGIVRAGRVDDRGFAGTGGGV